MFAEWQEGEILVGGPREDAQTGKGAHQSEKQAYISTHNFSDFTALKRPVFQQVGDPEFGSDVDCLRCPIRTCHLKQHRRKLAVDSRFGAPPREQSTFEKLRKFWPGVCFPRSGENTKKGLKSD